MGIGSRARRTPTGVVVAAALVALLAACWWWGPLPGDGRLRAGLGGTTALGAPPADVWTATVGGGLCTDGDPVTIDSVDAETSGDVRDLRFQVLTMQPADIRASGAGGYGAARGTPPDFAEAYGDRDPLPGAYTDATGTEVTAPCEQGRGPASSEQQSLLVVATVGPQGGAISDVRVTYRSWLRNRSSGDDQRVVVCGVDQQTQGCPSMTVDNQGRSVEP